MEGEVETKRARREEKILMNMEMEEPEPASNQYEQQSRIRYNATKRGIKFKGGYAPPPRRTKEEAAAYCAQIRNIMAAAGLEFLNKRRPNGDHYELVMARPSTFFRTNEGWRYHNNFVAKISNDPNAEETLFFAFIKIRLIDHDTFFFGSHAPFEVLECVNLGPIDNDSERCRNCDICKKMGISCPTFHPIRPDIVHSCQLCECVHPSYAIFHPPGLKVDHLRYVAKSSRVTEKGEKV